jgi:hypothetical protein
MKFHLQWIVVALLITVGQSSMTLAQSPSAAAFRINTDIYKDPSEPPIKRSLTLFSQGVYYDLDDLDSTQITVIDPIRARIILLDRTRKIQTRLSMPEVEQKLSSALQQMDPKLSKFLTTSSLKSTDPNFVVVGNDNLKYESKIVAVEDPSIAQQYAEFADWSARINAIFPPSIPPFLRIQLNRAILEKGAIPSELDRTTRLNGRESKLTCKILPLWTLNNDDLKTIERIGGMLAQFDQKDLETFQQK